MEERDIKNSDKKVDKKFTFLISLSLYLILSLIFLYLFLKIVIIDRNVTGNNITLMVGMLLSIIFLRFFIIGKKLKDTAMANMRLGGVSILRYEINEKQVKAGDDIFLEGFKVTNPNNIGIFNIHIELEGSREQQSLERSRLRLIIYKTLNSKIISEENKEITGICDLEIFTKPEEMLNIKFEKEAIIKKLTVVEIYIP